MKANALLKIKRSNPVATKVQSEDDNGDTQVYEEKSAVDGQIAKYFSNIYKRQDQRREQYRSIDFNVDEDSEMRIDTSSIMNVSPFTKEEVTEATNCSNFNKGMGPDCFDGNVMRNHKQLEDKIINEIT